MDITVGSESKTRVVGLVACECGLCRRVTRQQLLARHTADHVLQVSVFQNIDHRRLCLECGNTTIADITRHPRVVSEPWGPSLPLLELAAQTYPQARDADAYYAELEKRRMDGDGEAKHELLVTALAAVEWSLESQSPTLTFGNRFFQVAAPLAVAGFGLWHALMDGDGFSVGMAVAFVAVAVLIVEVRMLRPLRASKKNIIPLLLRSLAPLHATLDQLTRAFAPFVARGSALAYVTSPADLTTALSRGDVAPAWGRPPAPA